MKLISLLILLSLNWMYHPVTPRIVSVQKDISLTSQIKDCDRTYVISHNFDLNGDTLVMPPNCILAFKGGCIENGTIEGNKTEIKADRKLLFKNVAITGDYINKTVYSEWFQLIEGGADNKDTFNAIMSLANGDVNTDVYIQKGLYHTSVGPHGDGIRLPSGTYVHNESTIVALPSFLEKYNIITIKDVSNVTFEGGKVVGDVTSHLGNTGEWGYGIALTGAKNATVRNVFVTQCWGDGINVQALYSDYLNKTIDGHCYNILIDNVVCDDNRRQGMSIEGCIGIDVIRSTFSNTGMSKAILPTAGIDIEPWFDTQVVQDIVISECEFYNNKGGNLIAPLTTKLWELGNCKNFTIKNNTFDDYVVRFNRVRDVLFEDNTVGTEHGLLEFNQYSDISILSNTINGKVGIYTESESYGGIFNRNTVYGGERLSMAIEEISNNDIYGCLILREDVECVVRDNDIHAVTSSGEYSFICDNTKLQMYGNTIELNKPMIFRYKSHVVIYDNKFIALSELKPACLILQTARDSQLPEDGIIRDNALSGSSKFSVNYSAKGKYTLSNNVIL